MEINTGYRVRNTFVLERIVFRERTTFKKGVEKGKEKIYIKNSNMDVKSFIKFS